MRVDEFQPVMHNNPAEIELISFRQFRWWTAREISQSNAEFAPRQLSEHLEKLIDSGPPKSPINVGI